MLFSSYTLLHIHTGPHIHTGHIIMMKQAHRTTKKNNVCVCKLAFAHVVFWEIKWVITYFKDM